MKLKFASITLSILVAFMLISDAYGLWEKKLTIKGTIEVVDIEELYYGDGVNAIAEDVYGQTNSDQIINQTVLEEVY